LARPRRSYEEQFKGQFEFGVSCLVGPVRRVGPVGPRGIQGITSAKRGLLKKLIRELPVLSKKLFKVIVICCGL
jgi:hypothetical protein